MLTGAYVDYIECVSSLNTERLDQMFRADIAAWENNLEQTKEHA